MNPNNQTISDDEIDLREIILTLWKEKYLIFIVTLVFTVAGYIYGNLQPKIYQSTVTLRDAPISIFKKYESFISTQQQQQQQKQKQQQQQQQQQSLALNFNQDLKLNLSSLDNLVKFVEQNKKIDEFKSYLKTNNIKTRAYFSGKFQPILDKKNKPTNQYALNFSIPLPGTEFLNDYIIYIKKVSLDEYREQLKESIKNEIEIYDQNYKISKSINLENPILKSFAEGYSVVNEPQALFYKGSKVLSLQKSYLEELLKETDNSTFNFNLILEHASIPTLVTKSSSFFMVIAFAFGLFFSIIVIFIRSMFVR